MLLSRILLSSSFLAILSLSGLSLQAKATEKKMAVEFQGNKAFSSERLHKRLSLCLARYSDSEDEYDARAFDFCLHEVTFFLRENGYLESKVSEPRIENTKDRLRITVLVKEGILYRLGGIEIKGTKFLSPENLREMLPLKQGEIANGEAIGEWLYKHAKKRYQDEGYIQIVFDLETDYKLVPETGEGIVNLRVDTWEGPRFTVRKIQVQGDRDVPAEMINNALSVRENEIYSEQRLIETINNLNDLDRFDWIDKERDTDLKLNEDEGSVVITIKVRMKQKNQKVEP